MGAGLTAPPRRAAKETEGGAAGMETLRALVRQVERAESEEETIRTLQTIGGLLLTDYEIHISGRETLHPLWVEAYYYPYRTPERFNDPSAHPSPRKLGAFGKLYFIESKYGFPGVDLCLSQGDYYLSFLLKRSRMGERFFRQQDLFDHLRDRREALEGRAALREAAGPRPRPPVFHTARIGLRESRTKFAQAPLAAVIDLRNPYNWERGYGKIWTVANYLAEHRLPAEDGIIRELLGTRSEAVKRTYAEIVRRRQGERPRPAAEAQTVDPRCGPAGPGV